MCRLFSRLRVVLIGGFFLLFLFGLVLFCSLLGKLVFEVEGNGVVLLPLTRCDVVCYRFGIDRGRFVSFGHLFLLLGSLWNGSNLLLGRFEFFKNWVLALIFVVNGHHFQLGTSIWTTSILILDSFYPLC